MTEKKASDRLFDIFRSGRLTYNHVSVPADVIEGVLKELGKYRKKVTKTGYYAVNSSLWVSNTPEDAKDRYDDFGYTGDPIVFTVTWEEWEDA